MKLVLFLLNFSVIIGVNVDCFHFAVGTRAGYVKIFNQSNQIFSFNNSAKSYTSLELIKNTFLAAGSIDGTIDFYNLKKKNFEFSLNHPSSKITSLLVINETYFLSASNDGSIKIWNLTDFSELKFISDAHKNGIVKLKSIPNNFNYFISLGSDEILKFWNLITFISTRNNSLVCGNFQEIEIIDANFIALACIVNTRIHFINGTTNFVQPPGNQTTSLVKLNSSFLLSGLENGQIKLLDIEKRIFIKTINAHTKQVKSMKIFEKILISISDDNSVKLWNKENFEPISLFNVQMPSCVILINEDLSDQNDVIYIKRDDFYNYLNLIISNIELNNCLKNCSDNGRCKYYLKKNFLECECFENFTGSSCQIDKRPCSSSPCLNNGTCINESTGFRCECEKEFHYGKYCEKEIDLCANETCSNNGICVINDNHEIKCKCFYLYSGTKCELELREIVIRKFIIKTSTIISITIIIVFFFFLICCDFCRLIQKKKPRSKKKLTIIKLKYVN